MKSIQIFGVLFMAATSTAIFVIEENVTIAPLSGKISRLLEKMETAESAMKKLQKRSLVIGNDFPKMLIRISSILEDNPMALEAKRLLKEEPIESKCHEIFEAKLKFIVNLFYKHVKNTMARNLLDLHQSLNAIISDLKETKEVLRAQMEMMNNGSLTCNEKNYYCAWLTEDISTVNSILNLASQQENVLLNKVESSYLMLDDEENSQVLMNNLLVPVTLCMIRKDYATKKSNEIV